MHYGVYQNNEYSVAVVTIIIIAVRQNALDGGGNGIAIYIVTTTSLNNNIYYVHLKHPPFCVRSRGSIVGTSRKSLFARCRTEFATCVIKNNSQLC